MCGQYELPRTGSLDTDVMNFFALSGWEYYWSPLYQDADQACRAKLEAAHARSRANLERGVRHAEARFVESIRRQYFEGKVQTLRDLKTVIEDYGLVYEGMGSKGFERFNIALAQFGLTPFRARKHRR